MSKSFVSFYFIALFNCWHRHVFFLVYYSLFFYQFGLQCSIAPFASIIGSSWCLYHFYNPIFHNIYTFSNEWNVLLFHAFLYILLVLGLGNQTQKDQLFQIFVRTIYILGLIRFYNVCLIVSSWLALVLCCYHYPLCLYLQSSIFQSSISCYLFIYLICVCSFFFFLL